jgi:DNA-binding NarL/FixJ family response regulator
MHRGKIAMPKDIRVLIVEDDPYARDMMSLLLTRDWRTRVVGEVANKGDLDLFLSDEMSKVDVVVLDTEIPGGTGLHFKMAEMTQTLPKPPKILYTATMANRDVLDKIIHRGCSGYILKQEILYALGAAVALIDSDTCVVTPGVRNIAGRYALPDGTLILDGRRLTTNFSRRENELIRLGIIFNLAIRDIADELVIGAGWVSEIVSTVYRKLGIREILTGEIPLDMYFTDEAVLAHCKEITKRATSNRPAGQIRKAPWMSTLAFHLLTVPEVTES